MIVALQGGLGNQLFQYAFGCSVSIIKEEPLFFQNRIANKDHHQYGLADFHAGILCFGGKIRYEYHEIEFGFDPKVYEQREDTLFVGYWQTEKYFNEPVIRDKVRMRTPMSPEGMYWASRLSSAPTSCFVHVRHGDYLKEPHKSFHGNLDMRYYEKAMARIRDRYPDVTFFVFSDDPEWAHQAFDSSRWSIVDMWRYDLYSRCEIVDHSSAYEGLFLMKLCDHAIIANSSYSWWGAWLGDERQDRMVIAPQKWFSDASKMRYDDVVPARWLRIPNE